MILDALESRLDGALQYTIFSHGTSLIKQHNFGDDDDPITQFSFWAYITSIA